MCAADAKSSDTSVDLQEGPKHAIEAAAVQATIASSSADGAPSSSTESASPQFTYALSGVVRHLGVDCRSGHYVADIPDSSTATYKTGAPRNGSAVMTWA